jgi:hypothetical protein
MRNEQKKRKEKEVKNENIAQAKSQTRARQFFSFISFSLLSIFMYLEYAKNRKERNLMFLLYYYFYYFNIQFCRLSLPPRIAHRRACVCVFLDKKNPQTIYNK